MSDSSPPRVRLPDGTHARLLRWRQDKTDRWWAEVTLYAPATALQPVGGEDYSSVPREAAAPDEPRYVLNAVPGGRHVLHALNGTCFAVDEKQNPAIDAAVALDALAAGAEPCEICTPEP